MLQLKKCQARYSVLFQHDAAPESPVQRGPVHHDRVLDIVARIGHNGHGRVLGEGGGFGYVLGDHFFLFVCVFWGRGGLVMFWVSICFCFVFVFLGERREVSNEMKYKGDGSLLKEN